MINQIIKASILFIFLLSCSALSGQQRTGTQIFKNGVELERCGMETALNNRFAKDPSLYKRFLDNQNKLHRRVTNRVACTGTNEVAIPLAFHFDNSFSCADEACMLVAIQDEIDALNIAFSDNSSSPNATNCTAAYSAISNGTCISFYLAEPPGCADAATTACNAAISIGEFVGGYEAGGSGAGTCWDDYLNIFIQPAAGTLLGVADQIPDGLPASGPGEGVSVGAAYFGGSSGACAPFNTDPTFDEGKTLIHEVGHYLGLFHTFQGGCQDEPNNTFGGVDITVGDTPAQQTSFEGCPTGCVNSGCGGSQQTANFMNYTDDACMDLFSEGQAVAMNIVANGLFGSLSIPAGDIMAGDLLGLCPSGACQLICPSSVNTMINSVLDFCDDSGILTLSESGISLDESSDAVYSWSTDDYLSAGGTAIASNTVGPLTTAPCTITSQVYYLNVDCGTTPLPTTLDGGTITINVYPGPPADLSSLVTITGENTCDEPIVTAILGCENYISITPDATNPTFPVSAGDMGISGYSLAYISDPAGPDCCVDEAGQELIVNGDFEAGTAPWIEVEEAPIGTPITFGIIGVSGGFLNGTNDAWFGGWGLEIGPNSVLSSYLSLSQDITIPATCTSATLSFDYEALCIGNATIVFNVIVGGVTVASFDCSAGSGTFSIDLLASGVAPGINTLLFEGIEDDPNPRNNDDSANFFIDNVTLVSGNCPSTTCDLAIITNYDCAACPTCFTNLTHSSACDLQTVETGVVDYESSDWIATGDNTLIQTGAQVEYDATDYIELNGTLDHTFEVEAGAIFHAFIDGCGGNMIRIKNSENE